MVGACGPHARGVRAPTAKDDGTASGCGRGCRASSRTDRAVDPVEGPCPPGTAALLPGQASDRLAASTASPDAPRAIGCRCRSRSRAAARLPVPETDRQRGLPGPGSDLPGRSQAMSRFLVCSCWRVAREARQRIRIPLSAPLDSPVRIADVPRVGVRRPRRRIGRGHEPHPTNAAQDPGRQEDRTERDGDLRPMRRVASSATSTSAPPIEATRKPAISCTMPAIRPSETASFTSPARPPPRMALDATSRPAPPDRRPRRSGGPGPCWPGRDPSPPPRGPG